MLVLVLLLLLLLLVARGNLQKTLHTHTGRMPADTYTHTHTNFRAYTGRDTYTLRTDTVASSHTLAAKGGNERSSRTYAHAHLRASWKMSITKNHCSFALSSRPSLFLTIFLVCLSVHSLARPFARSLARCIRSYTLAPIFFSSIFSISPIFPFSRAVKSVSGKNFLSFYARFFSRRETFHVSLTSSREDR